MCLLFIPQVKEIDSDEKYACLDCWSKVESFHEFYTLVAANYQNNANAIDGTASINPLLDCEGEIKVEIDRFDSCVSNYEAIYIPSTFDWDDSNKQINEDSSKSQKQQNNSPCKAKAANQETVCLQLEEAEGLEPRNRSTSVPKKKKTIRTKPDSDEWEPKIRIHPRDAIITIDGVV